MGLNNNKFYGYSRICCSHKNNIMAKKYMTCIKLCFPQEKKLNKSTIADLGGTVFASVNPRPNSNGHSMIVTKRHTADLHTLMPQE